MPMRDLTRSVTRIIAAVLLARPDARLCLGLVSGVFLLVVCGYMMLLAAYRLPEESLRQNILKAWNEGYFAENHPRRSKDMVTGKRYDMWTECTAIGGAMGRGRTLTDLLEMKYYGECAALSAAAARGFAEAPGIQYMRYIHGYQILLKPLYTFFDIYKVRCLTAAMTVSLLLALFFTIKRHVGLPQAALASLSFLLPCSPNVFIMVTHAVQFWLVLAGSIAAVAAFKKIRPLLFFGLLGAADAFVSNLSMGSLSLGLPLLCYTLRAWAEDEEAENILACSFWGCIGWSIGFVLPWLIKWAALLAVVQPQFDELFSNKVQEYAASGVGMIALALFKNISTTHWEVWLPLFLFLLFRRLVLRPETPAGLWTTVLPALIPVVWVCLLPGQSGIKHSSFTNMIFWPSFACAALLLLPMSKDADLLAEIRRKIIFWRKGAV